MFLATPGWHMCFLSILARAMSAGLGEQRGGEGGGGGAQAKAKGAGEFEKAASAEAEAKAKAKAKAGAEEESDAGAVVQLALHVLVTLLHASMEEEGTT